MCADYRPKRRVSRERILLDGTNQDNGEPRCQLTRLQVNLESDVTTADLATVVAFGCGCAIGLLSFSRVLRWLLANHKSATLAILCGFMFGSLPKIWPFQYDKSPNIVKLNHKVFEIYWPQELTSQVLLVGLVVIGAAAIIGVIAWIAERIEVEAADENSSSEPEVS